MDDLLDDDPFEDLLRSDSEVTASFEAFQRLVNSHTALEDLLSQHDHAPYASFESAARPLLTAITGDTGMVWDLEDVSVESVKTVAASVIRAVIAALQNFFKALLDFFTNIDLAATWLSRKLTFLERQAATTRGMRPSEPTVTLGRSGRYMRVHGAQVDDAAKLEFQLNQLHRVVKVMVTDYRQAVVNAGQELPSAARGKSGKVLADALVATINKIPFDELAAKCNMHAAPYDRFKRSNVQATHSLLGGFSLFYLRGDLRARGVEAFRFHGFLFEKTGRNELKVEREYTLSTLQPGQIGELPKLIREMLNTVSRGSNSGIRTAATKTKSTLDAFIKTAAFEPSDMDVVRKTVGTVTHWLQQPSRSLLVHTMSVCRAAIAYCHVSMKTYR